MLEILLFDFLASANLVKIKKSNISACGCLRKILAESHDQYPLIDKLMAARSSTEAVHVLLTGKPLKGGGPLNSKEST